MPAATPRARRRCPSCGSANLAAILWGMPNDDVTFLAPDAPLVIAGCCVPEPAPAFECESCGVRFGESEADHEAANRRINRMFAAARRRRDARST